MRTSQVTVLLFLTLILCAGALTCGSRQRSEDSTELYDDDRTAGIDASIDSSVSVDGHQVVVSPETDGALPEGHSSKLAPSAYQASSSDGGAVPEVGVVPDITEGIHGVPPDFTAGKSVPLPASVEYLAPDVKTQLVRALSVRKWLDDQMHHLNYLIDNNLTKNPADVVRLNRFVRAKRELDAALLNMAHQFDIPDEALKMQR